MVDYYYYCREGGRALTGMVDFLFFIVGGSHWTRVNRFFFFWVSFVPFPSSRMCACALGTTLLLYRYHVAGRENRLAGYLYVASKMKHKHEARARAQSAKRKAQNTVGRGGKICMY